MGAWGYGPVDNDTAADWYIPIGKYLADKVDEVFEIEETDPRGNGDYHRIIAACDLLVRMGFTYIWDIHRLDTQLLKAIELLNRIKNNTEYVNSWKSPQSFIIEIDSLAEKLLKKIESRK